MYTLGRGNYNLPGAGDTYRGQTPPWEEDWNDEEPEPEPCPVCGIVDDENCCISLRGVWIVKGGVAMAPEGEPVVAEIAAERHELFINGIPMTKKDVAQQLGLDELRIDYALPIGFSEELRRHFPLEVYPEGEFVWSYEDGSTIGFPRALTPCGRRMLQVLASVHSALSYEIDLPVLGEEVVVE
jgi:hypothetical protein